jgi:hypothetical protein
MFQFSGFAHLSVYYVFNIVGCPIRKSPDQNVCAIPRSLSQLITSFFASESHRHPPCALILLIVLFSNQLTAASQKLSVLSIFFLLFVLSQYVNERCSLLLTAVSFSFSGEYRSRTDDLLRARQAL